MTVRQAQAADPPADGNWPQFRGWNARGIGTGAPPTTWSGVMLEYVKWKTRIPGMGHSSPIVWGDRIFVTTAVSGKEDPELRVGLYGDIMPVDDTTEHSWKVLCLDRATGEVLWERTAHVGVPAIKRHTKATHANSTPCTDGKHVVAFFGSEGLYCYDFDGKLLWKKDFGTLDSGYYVVPPAQWGFGSSPIIYRDMVMVQCDVQKGSFLAAFDIKDGKERWRTERKDVPTWSTPTIHEPADGSAGRVELLVNGYKHMGGYDPLTGKELWRMAGGGDIPVPTPVVAHGLVYFTSAHGGPMPLFAVRLGAEGDITLKESEKSNQYVAWHLPSRGTYMQTPIIYGDYLYACTDHGILTTFKARTGEQTARQRVGDGGTGFTASPVAADDRLFITSEEGEVHVFDATAEPSLLAVNLMGEVCMATPAISNGQIFFRGRDHLFCIGN